MKTIFKDYHFETRNGIKGVIPNVEHTVETNVFGDGEEEFFISAKVGRMIDAEILKADPLAFRERKRRVDKPQK